MNKVVHYHCDKYGEKPTRLMNKSDLVITFLGETVRKGTGSYYLTRYQA